ncbi:hypothetical protein ACFSTA_12560 [Ornithinibacillus salinisoli]|uniref:Uncharacterized protein n=1 Tax=Ornithinibacillus salinisoli TaxID=1848459 RepID=A0ABW4W3S8_9BACI
MEKQKEDMPIWQNHEQRITALEVTMQGLSHKMDSVQETIKESNKEQKELLNTINNRMVDEFFKKKKVNLNNGWKLLFTLLGGGSFLYLLIDQLIK